MDPGDHPDTLIDGGDSVQVTFRRLIHATLIIQSSHDSSTEAGCTPSYREERSRKHPKDHAIGATAPVVRIVGCALGPEGYSFKGISTEPHSSTDARLAWVTRSRDARPVRGRDSLKPNRVKGRAMLNGDYTIYFVGFALMVVVIGGKILIG